jgi:zinc protease
MMRKILIGALMAVTLAAAGDAAGQFFPYQIQKRTLPNGLDVLVIETPEFKDVVNVNTLILAGSRNEVEKGRSGLAHLFEHIAFRHRYEDPANSYDTRIEKMGAFDNAWTWFDVTYYHPVTFSSNLRDLIALQAERFVAMEFSERIYRTEAGAVLGEYRRNASDPGLRMDEVLIDLAYGPKHGYGHTTMGYLADVEDMPNSYRSGKAFYETWYRPNNAVVLVTGDVKADEVFRLVEEHYGKWKPGKVPSLPKAGAINGPKRGHVEWEADVPPRIVYAHLVPALDPGSTEGAVLALLPELIAGRTAPLYQELRYQKQIATEMAVSRMSAEGFDARLLETYVRLDKEKFDAQGRTLFSETEQALDRGFSELKNFSRRPDAQTTLEALKSRYRYDLLSSLNSPANIASTVAWYYRFERDPKVLDTLVTAVERLTTQDIDAFASRYFTPANKALVTMAHKGAAR